MRPLIRGVVAGLLAVAVVVGTVVLVGPADLAASYAVPLLLAVLAGVVVAARQTRIEASDGFASWWRSGCGSLATCMMWSVTGWAAITVQAGAGRMALAAGADAEVRRALLDHRAGWPGGAARGALAGRRAARPAGAPHDE